MIIPSTRGEKYLHCGGCWDVIREIPAIEPKTQFNLVDCGWPCDNCGRYNFTDDVLVEIRDNNDAEHIVFARGNEELIQVDTIPAGFEFTKLAKNTDREGLKHHLVSQRDLPAPSL